MTPPEAALTITRVLRDMRISLIIDVGIIAMFLTVCATAIFSGMAATAAFNAFFAGFLIRDLPKKYSAFRETAVLLRAVRVWSAVYVYMLWHATLRGIEIE